MKSLITKISAVIIVGAALASCDTMASENESMYEVTITNITHGEIFTPIMVASHKKGVKIFNLGESASLALEDLAESGNPGALTTNLLESGDALDVAQAGGVLLPGKSITLNVKMNKRNSYITVASMLVPSNDAFFAVNGHHVGKAKNPITIYSPVYDAGSELNDEQCGSIPGPPHVCTGEGTNLESGEGFVHIHPGIQGIGSLDTAQFDWRNPAAKITITRVKN